MRAFSRGATSDATDVDVLACCKVNGFDNSQGLPFFDPVFLTDGVRCDSGCQCLTFPDRSGQTHFLSILNELLVFRPVVYGGVQ